MAEQGLVSGRLGLAIATLIVVVLVYQVFGRGCTVASIGLENGVSFSCAGDEATVAPPKPAAEHPPAATDASAGNPAPARPPSEAGNNAGAAPVDFAGEWRNVDRGTRGLTRLIVSESPAAIHAWGRCQPSDCDWGAVPAASFRQSVNGGSDAALRAQFTTGFSETTLIITPAGRDMMSVETLTHFTDKSGRADYSVRDEFRRFGS